MWNFVWNRFEKRLFYVKIFSNPINFFQFKTKKKNGWIPLFYAIQPFFWLIILSGQRGIRTLDTLLTYTRVPVVRLRPAQPSVHYGASNGTWTHTSLDTRPSNVPVCLFQHTRNYSIIIHQWETIVNTRLFIFLL